MKKITQFKVGQEASDEKIFGADLVKSYARITGDKNPLHLDREFARNSIFGKPVVHGMLVSGMFSSILGMKLPGEGSIYLSQELKFLKPVFVGDKVRATVRILEIEAEKNRIFLETIAVNGNGEVVIQGKALIKIMENDSSTG